MPLVKRRHATPPSRTTANAPGGDPDALLAMLATEPAREVREAILTALIAGGTAAAAEGLAALIGSEDASLRSAAIEALRRMEGSVALPPVLALLDHPDADRRLLAVGVLEAFPAAAVRARLRALLEHDLEPNVGLAAVEVLAQVGEAEDAPALAGFAARFPEEPMVGFAVRLALGQIGSPPP